MPEAVLTRDSLQLQVAVPAVLRKVYLPMQVEGIAMKEDSLARLGELAEQTTLRHAVQLLTPAHVLSKNSGREEITAADVEEVHALFRDAKYTAHLLTEQADKYIQ